MRIVIILGSLFMIVACNSKEKAIYPKVGTITTSIYASAIVQPDSAYMVYSNVGGILEVCHIEEGDVVTPETSLFKVTNSTSRSNAQNASLQLALSKERYSGGSSILQSLRVSINAAALVVTNDSINYDRQSRLWKGKIGSKVEYESRKLKYEQSLAHYNMLKNEYKLKEKELKSLIQQAHNAYTAAVSQDADFTIRSKIYGKVYDVSINPGEIITPQKGLAYLGSASSFIVEMLIDEVDIIQVTLDQQVLVALEAYPEQVFIARVSKIYPQKDLRNQTFKVEARFVNSPQKLYAGLSGEANIITKVKDSALVIPISYLAGRNQVKTATGLVAVTTGLKSIDSVEIIGGIKAKTPLYKPLQ